MKHYLTIALLLTSTLALAEKQIEHSYNYSYGDYSKNKVNSASGIILPNLNYEATFRADQSETYETFLGAGIRTALSSMSHQDGEPSNLVFGVNVKAGSRARLGENFRLGVGATYSYNFAKENFQDLTIFSQSRYYGKDSKGKTSYIQLEVGKSVTDEKGYSIGVGAGQQF